MNKFQYAPGRPGLGSKGKDGLPGLQGLSMYFTDLNPTSDINLINNRIANNLDLWIGDGHKLPDGRVYSTGDLFIDAIGNIYLINADTNTFQFKFANLNTGFFTPANVSTSQHNYNRYYNLNTFPKYLIDNVFSNGAVAYYLTPDTIYGVNARDFARIEFSNINQNGHNHFTLFTAGENDHSAIGIVREINSNTFRIGNLNNEGKLRNVNLIFDVSSLRQTKQIGVNEFNSNTPLGTILTNYEIQANGLFTGDFNTNPVSFNAGFGVNDVSIFWTLGAFTSEQNLNMDLYFFRDVSSISSFSMINDASLLRPLVFHNCVSVGSIRITGLPTSTNYKYYMNFHKNGWERRSVIKSISTGIVPFMTISPTSFISGSEGFVGNSSIGFCVSSNVPWNASIGINPDGFITNVFPVSGLPGRDVSIFVNLSPNTQCENRSGNIIVSSITPGGNSPRIIPIQQMGACVPVFITVNSQQYFCDMMGERNYQSGTIDISGLTPAHTYNLDISLNAIAVNSNFANTSVNQINYELIFRIDNNIIHTFNNSLFNILRGETRAMHQNLNIVGLKDTSIVSFEARVQGFSTHQLYAGNMSFNVKNISITSGPDIILTEGDMFGGAGIICN